MSTKLRVGNLGSAIDAVKLKEIFGQFGTVEDAYISVYGLSGKSRGFGFVEMSNRQEADECILKLNGHDQEGRALLVADAPPEKTRGRAKRSTT